MNWKLVWLKFQSSINCHWFTMHIQFLTSTLEVVTFRTIKLLEITRKMPRQTCMENLVFIKKGLSRRNKITGVHLQQSVKTVYQSINANTDSILTRFWNNSIDGRLNKKDKTTPVVPTDWLKTTLPL